MPGIQERRTAAWDSYRKRLDWVRITEVIDQVAEEKNQLLQSEIEQARMSTFIGLERWLAEDLANCQVFSVEDAFEDTFKRGVADIILHILPEPEDEVYKPHANQLMGIDWKTSRNTLGSDWRDRHVNSWQGPTYTHGIALKYSLTPTLFQYRGISRSGECKPVLLEVREDVAPAVEVQYGGLQAMRQALVAGGFLVWPKNMPSACHAFNRDCEYWRDCVNGTEPRFVPEDKILSYSSATTFLLCPEKHRRNTVDGSSDSEETIFGNMVHAGLAEAYRQVKEWIV